MSDSDPKRELVEMIVPQLTKGATTVYLSLPHMLYLTDRQSKLYEEATSRNPRYRDSIDAPIATLLRENQSEILAHIGGRANFIDLGPGYPSKSLGLVDELLARGTQLTYYAVDVSPYFLDRAVSAALQRNVQAIGIRRRFEELGPILDRRLSPAVARVIFLGLTFNNFPLSTIVGVLAEVTRPGDICLVCHQPSDGISDSELLRPYEGDKVRNFASEPLLLAGLPLEMLSYAPRVREHIVETRFVLTRDAHWRGRTIKEGTEFVTAESYRLPSAEVLAAIESRMAVVREYVDTASGISLLHLTGRQGNDFDGN